MEPLTMAGATALAGGLSAGASIGNSIIGGNLNKKNRKFNAEQAQLNRDFQAQQADIARSWQESFYNQYQSPAAIMRQASEAGIHPYAALGLNPASGPSGTSIPSGSQASAPPQQFQGLADISGTILSLMKLKSEIDLNEKLGAKYLSETEGINITNTYSARQFEQKLAKGEVDIELAKKNISLYDEKINTLKTEQNVNNWRWRDYLAGIGVKSSTIAKLNKEVEQIGVENFYKLILAGNEILRSKLITAQTNEINARVFEQEWLNDMLKKHNINPRFAQTIYGLSLQGLTSSLDENNRTVKFDNNFLDDLINQGTTGITDWLLKRRNSYSSNSAYNNYSKR